MEAEKIAENIISIILGIFAIFCIFIEKITPKRDK